MMMNIQRSKRNVICAFMYIKARVNEKKNNQKDETYKAKTPFRNNENVSAPR